MAITYNFNIKRVGSSNSFSIGATITDDTRPVGHQTEIVSVAGKLGTPEQKQGVWDGIQAGYLKKIAESNAMSVLETDGKSYLEAL